MPSGFRDEQNNWRHKCPSCGRFVDHESATAFYCREYKGDTNVSAFCNEKCATGYPKSEAS